MADTLVGGYGEIRTDAEGLNKITEWKGLIQTRAGRTFTPFVPTEYRTQLVNGTNYKAKIRVGGEEYIHAVVYESFDHQEVECSEVETGKTEADPLN